MSSSSPKPAHRSKKSRKKRAKKSVRIAGITLLLAVVCLSAFLIYQTLAKSGKTAPESSDPKTAMQSSSGNNAQSTSASAASATPEPVKITAIGDVLLEEPILNYFGSGDWKDYMDDIRPILQEDDLTIANQEVPIGGEELGIEGIDFQFNSPNATAKNLADTSIEFVSLANNHAMDRGLQGIINTEANLDAAGIGHTGAYSSEEEAGSFEIREINGMKIAILSTTYGTNKPVDPAWSVNVFQSVYSDASDKIIADIQEAKKQADAVIVCVHWGIEFTYELSDEQTILSQAMADAGADVIIGNHPHCIQPAEWLTRPDGSKTLCFYSLGNFIASAYEVDRASELFQNMYEVGAMAQFTLTPVENGTRVTVEDVQLIPIVNHFEGDYSYYRLMPLKDYSEDLAAKHDQRSFSDQFTLETLKDQVHQVFDPSGIPILLD